MNKTELFAQGLDLMLQFGKLNNFVLPMAHRWPKEDRWPFPHACAYYRPNQITICVRRCAHIGTGGAWDQVLATAPPRTLNAATKKVNETQQV